MGDYNSVLILSLGATPKPNLDANALDMKLQENFKNNIRAYITANYSVNDSNSQNEYRVFEETPFVAEPLIEITNPDEVVVIGSVLSTWSSFYLTFAKNPSIEGYKELSNIEYGDKYQIIEGTLVERNGQIKMPCGISTGGSELDVYEQKVNEIFRKAGGIHTKTGKTPSLKIILIRYGVDEEQLTENYGRFKKITNVLKPGVKNEVSFDTTLSFRSIPLYNLVLLNYIETIEDYEIVIKHVFNGCFEAKSEYTVIKEGRELHTSPIIDLHGIVDLMELTDAVREFINTGNAIALTSTDGAYEDDFLKYLKMFDWATQINDFRMIEESIEKLAAFENILFEQRKASALNDRSKMILTVIKRNMLKGKNLSDFKKLSAAEKRLMIAEWYQKQNRYGQAIATAIEAMRSLIVTYYLESKHTGKDHLKVEEDKERNRRDAEDRLLKLKDYLIKNRTEPYNEESLEKAIINAVESFIPARIVRNTFAHNLTTESKNKPELFNIKGENARIIIDNYLHCLRTLYQKVSENEDAFRELYRKDISFKGAAAKDKINGAVIIIDFMNDKLDHSIWDHQLREFKKDKKYQMPASVFTKGGRDLMYSKAAVDYLDNHFNIERTSAILRVTSLKKVSALVPMLNAHSFRNVIVLVRDKEIARFPKDFYEDDYLEEIRAVIVTDECNKEFESIVPYEYEC